MGAGENPLDDAIREFSASAALLRQMTLKKRDYVLSFHPGIRAEEELQRSLACREELERQWRRSDDQQRAAVTEQLGRVGSDIHRFRSNILTLRQRALLAERMADLARLLRLAEGEIKRCHVGVVRVSPKNVSRAKEGVHHIREKKKALQKALAQARTAMCFPSFFSSRHCIKPEFDDFLDEAHEQMEDILEELRRMNRLE